MVAAPTQRETKLFTSGCLTCHMLTVTLTSYGGKAVTFPWAEHGCVTLLQLESTSMQQQKLKIDQEGSLSKPLNQLNIADNFLNPHTHFNEDITAVGKEQLTKAGSMSW